MSSALLSSEQRREQRDALTERELLARCRDAARVTMRGAAFSTDDRLDVASAIMADGLALTSGALPSRNDSRHTLMQYCQRAKTARRSLERQRERDTADAEASASAALWSADAILPDIIDVAPVCTPSGAARAADVAAWTLAAAPHSVCDGSGYGAVWSLLYRCARDLDGPVVAHEQNISPNALDVRCSRARTAMRERYPSALDLLRALLDRIDLDRSSAAKHASGSTLAEPATDAGRQWRTGTDGGRAATRPTGETREQRAAHARELCAVSHRRAAPMASERRRARADKRAGGRTQVEASSLLALSAALAGRNLPRSFDATDANAKDRTAALARGAKNLADGGRTDR